MTDQETVETQENQETPEVETPEAEAPETPAAETAEETAEAAPAEGTETPAEPEESPEDEERRHRRKGGWARTNDRLRQENEWLKEQLMGRAQAQPQTPKEETPEDKAAAYVQAMIKQGIAEERAREEQMRRARELQEREAKVMAKFPDYGDAVDAIAGAGVPQANLQAALTSEHGPEIMYRIAKDPDALARFAALPPAQAYLEVGRLEARLASSTAAPATPKPTIAPRRSAAPAPITPVRGRGPTSPKPAEKESYEEYEARRAAEIRKR